MNHIKSFFAKYWSHFVIVFLFFIVTLSYFNLQFQGYGLKQHDIEQFYGAANEIVDYRERVGGEPLWTNSMFGGMPAVQISVFYEGNYFKNLADGFVRNFPPPAGIVFLYMICFYIFALCVRLNPWVGFIGALAFAFATYDISIIQAGHNSKALAAAWMAPVIGALFMVYQRNLRWGIVLSAIFMTIELAQNHIQVSYYMGILIILLGIVFFIEAIRKKEFKKFTIATLGLIAAYLLAVAVNYGNISMTSDYAKHSIRGGNDITLNADGTSNQVNATSGLDKDYITEYSNGIGESFTLISPYVKGTSFGVMGNTHFAEQVKKMDFNGEEMDVLLNKSPLYWGNQPKVFAPSYLGIAIVFLAFIGLFFLRSPVKWAFFLASVLSLMLSWGENFMSLTNLFLENVPFYDKFRAPTIIIVVIEFCTIIAAVLCLDQLIKEREKIVEKKKLFLILSGSMLVFLVGLKMVGLGDDFASKSETTLMGNVMENISKDIKAQVLGMDPSQLMQKYKLDVKNQEQLDQFISQQAEPGEKKMDNLKVVRKSIFNSSMNRSILFLILAIGVMTLLFYTKINSLVVVFLMLFVVMLDLIPVAWNYLGNQEEGSGYRYWDIKTNTIYPISAKEVDMQILELETSLDPMLKKKVAEGERKGNQKAIELGYAGKEKRRVIDRYKFLALNQNTNYRVYDYSGGFNSAHASYFHKSLGGYNGAKLRSVQNVFEYHIAKSNNKVLDILNVKYLIQQTQTVMRANPNNGALGNAWFVKKINTFETPNDEIRALGNQFEVKNIGMGSLLVNNETKTSAKAYGSENLQYVIQNVTLDVSLSNDMTEGMEAYFVMDTNGKTNLVPKITLDMDTAKSFLKLVELKVTDEFKQRDEAIMLKSEAQKIKGKNFSGEGTISMTSYEPNKITYVAKAKGKQFAVFSEIYYPEGWTATIDGKEVEIRKADYLLRGLEIPSGSHKIEFSFMIPKYKKSSNYAMIGTWIMILSVFGMFFYDWKKKKAVN